MAAASVDADFSLVEGLDAPLLAALLEAPARGGQPPLLLVIAPTGRHAESLGPRSRRSCPAPRCWTSRRGRPCRTSGSARAPRPSGTRLDALRPHRALAGAARRIRSSSSRPCGRAAAARRQPRRVEPDRARRRRPRATTSPSVAARLVDLAYAPRRHGRRAAASSRCAAASSTSSRPTADHPVRVEFFGDEVEQIRAFSVADQRSLPERSCRVSSSSPSRELLLTAGRAPARARDAGTSSRASRGMLEKIAEGIPVEGMESLAAGAARAARAARRTTCPRARRSPCSQPERVVTPRRQPRRDEPRVPRARPGAPRPPAPRRRSTSPPATSSTLPRAARGRAQRRAATAPVVDVSALRLGSADAAAEGLIDVDGGRSRPPPTIARRRRRPCRASRATSTAPSTTSASCSRDGWSVVVAASGARPRRARARRARRARARRAHRSTRCPPTPNPGSPTSCRLDARARLRGARGEARGAQPRPSSTAARPATTPARSRSSRSGAERRRPAAAEGRRLRRAPDARHRQVRRADAARGLQRRPQRRSRACASTSCSSTRRRKRGYPGDKLFVPDRPARPAHAATSAARRPRCSKMGGSDWAQAKGRARKAVRDIAVELVKLYSARMAAKGHAFGPDTPWQRELEEAFPFAETPDQLQTIDEVKADMERPIPMDRLLVGRRRLRQDRGRRARRVQGHPGRQAGRDARADDAARQAAPRDVHRAVRRLPGARARALSRFQTDKEARETIAGLADGTRRHGHRHAPHPHRAGAVQGPRAASSSTRSSASASSTRTR